MKVELLSNGQYMVTHENLTLTQTTISGVKFNDCTIKHEDYYESVSEWNDLFKPLFIALHNYKIQF